MLYYFNDEFTAASVFYKNVPFRWEYFLGMMVLSGIVGTVATIAIKELGFMLFGQFTSALAFVLGYAGGDFIENIYKIIIKKSNLYEKWSCVDEP